MLSPAMQAQVDGYGQWAASRSNIDLETVTEVSESGDQVTVNLDQVRNGRAETYTAARFTVENGLITSD